MLKIMTLIGKTQVLLNHIISPIYKSYKRMFTICIEGNIGCGKTTFLNNFKQFDNVTILPEPVELWRNVAGTNLLDLMYTNPKRYSFLFQSYVNISMIKIHVYKSTMPYKIMERSIYSTRCFVENMKRTKILSDVEVEVLEDWHDWCTQNVNIEADLMIYLRTSPEVAYQRIQTRARKEENSITLDYLKQIHNIHDEWLYHQTLFTVPAPVLILDANKNLGDMLGEFENYKDQIFRKKEGNQNKIEILPDSF